MAAIIPPTATVVQASAPTAAYPSGHEPGRATIQGPRPRRVLDAAHPPRRGRGGLAGDRAQPRRLAFHPRHAPRALRLRVGQGWPRACAPTWTGRGVQPLGRPKPELVAEPGGRVDHFPRPT